MASVTSTTYGEYDFEDLLDSFEKNFAKKLVQRSSPLDTENAPKSLRPPMMKDEVYDISDFEDELTLFLEEIRKSVLSSRQTAEHGGSHHDDLPGGPDRLEKSIGKEVMRAEIRSVLEKLRNYEEQNLCEEDASSATKSTVASLKRQVKEANEEVAQLRRQKKQTEIQTRELHDANDACEAKIVLLTGKVRLLEIENEEITNKMQNADAAVQEMTIEKKRLEQNVTVLRGELLDSNHRTNQQKLKTIQAERLGEEMEARMLEMRMSEAALSERVKELHQVQEEMLEEMKKVIQSKDVPAARRALTNLSLRRSRIVGKIAAIMTRRHRGNEEIDDNSQAVGQSSTAAGHEGSDELPANESSPSMGGQQSPSVKRFATEDNSLQKLTSLLGRLRMVGNGTSTTQDGVTTAGDPSEGARRAPQVMSKADRHQIYESNLLKSRDAAEKDAVALQEVLDLKSNEIVRLEQELKDAKRQAAKLEEDLHIEKQHRLKENRNLHVPDDCKNTEEMEFSARRATTRTLFDWQDYEAERHLSPVAASDECDYEK